MKVRLPANRQRLLVWAIALGSAASVGLAAMPVVTRLGQRDQIWRAVAGDARPADALPQRVSLQPVLDLAPFGQAVSDLSPEAPQTTGAAAADMALQGVVVGADPATSMAILSIDGAAPASFRIGDTVANGAVLQSIAPDHVTVSLDGAARTLTFPDAIPSNDTQTAAAEPRSDSFLRTLIPTATTTPEPESPDTVRAALLRNPRATLQRYGITEQADGYAITDATPQTVLQIGLLPGDIITALNGEPVAGIAADGPLLDRVAASGTAQITLLRNGATQNLTVQW